jgi:hypothetical protein
MSNDDQNFTKREYEVYDKMTAVDLIRAMAALRIKKDAHEEAGKIITAEFDFLRNVKIPQVFEAQGLQIVKVEGVGRCNLTGDLQATIPSDQKDAAYTWLRDNGRGDLIQPIVNSSTLKAMIKGMMQGGEDVPDCFRVHVFSRASITKA